MMMKPLLLSALAAAFLTAEPAVSETMILKAERLIQPGSETIVSPATVIVEDGRIAEVNPQRLPRKAVTIDLGDRTLLPGYIDVHTHLTSDTTRPGWVHASTTMSASDRVLRAVPFARQTLEAGFTTVREVGSTGFGDIALKKAIEAGYIVGPRIVPSGNAIGITGGHCDTTGYQPGILETDIEDGVADGPYEAVAAVRYQIKHGAESIKVCATAGILSYGSAIGLQQLSLEELTAIVEEAERHQVKVTAHAHGAAGIRAAIDAGIHSIDHASMMDEETLQMAIDQGVFIIPTLAAMYWPDDDLPPIMQKKNRAILVYVKANTERAIAAGAKIVLGSDAGVITHGQNGDEFALLIAHGMTPMQALQAGTTNAAELLGLPDRGDIQVGMLADLVAVDGDPMSDPDALTAVAWVMKGGDVIVSPDE